MKAAIFIALIGIIGFQANVAGAGTIELDPIDSGTVSSYFNCYDGPCIYERFHSKPLDSLGSDFSDFSTGSAQAGYLIYDLAGLHGTIESATLRLDLTSVLYTEPTDHMVLFSTQDPATAAQLLLLPEGDISAELFNAVTVAPVLGVQTAPSVQGRGVYDITLNQAGLDLLAGTTGYLAVGLAWDIFDNDFYNPIFSSLIRFNDAPRLLLSGDIAYVPVPGTFSLLLLAGLLGCGRSIRRHRLAGC